MRVNRSPRQKVVSFKVTADARRVIEMLAAKFTLKRKCHHSLTDVVEEAIGLLAKREKVG